MNVPQQNRIRRFIICIRQIPEGIEECAYVHLTSDEGFDKGSFEPIVPKNVEETAIE